MCRSRTATMSDTTNKSLTMKIEMSSMIITNNMPESLWTEWFTENLRNVFIICAFLTWHSYLQQDSRTNTSFERCFGGRRYGAWVFTQSDQLCKGMPLYCIKKCQFQKLPLLQWNIFLRVTAANLPYCSVKHGRIVFGPPVLEKRSQLNISRDQRRGPCCSTFSQTLYNLLHPWHALARWRLFTDAQAHFP